MILLGKQSGPKLFVRLSKVSALEHVRLRQVLLYVVLNFTKLRCPEFAKFTEANLSKF